MEQAGFCHCGEKCGLSPYSRSIFCVKSFNKIAIAIAILLIALMIIWPMQQPELALPEASDSLLTLPVLGDGSELVRPIPTDVETDPAIAALGERLFNDSKISGNGFSCATCHQLDKGGVDHLATSMTTAGDFDTMNTPSIFNAALNPLQSWTGQFDNLADQLNSVINNQKHMNSSWPQLIHKISANPQYRESFQQALGKPVNRDSITRAITTFEKTLLTPNSDFDRYLNGDEQAISAAQQQGYRLFIDYGCVSCHQGVNLGGNLLARFGIYQNAFDNTDNLTPFDYGRYQLTGKPDDKFVFRVPSLRNVAVTAPYFHNGSADTLEQAIKTMARIQLNIKIPQHDVEKIKAFLQSLTGEYRGHRL